MNYKYNYLLANYTREPVTYTQAAKITGADPQVIQRDLAAWITEDSGLSFKMKSVTTVEWLRFFDNVELNELVCLFKLYSPVSILFSAIIKCF